MLSVCFAHPRCWLHLVVPVPTCVMQAALHMAWKPPQGTWLQLQRPLPRRGHSLFYRGMWHEIVPCVEIMSGWKTKQQARELAGKAGCSEGMHGLVRAPLCAGWVASALPAPPLLVFEFW